ncbi:MAG: hypothetical protein MHM6MM_004062 [Cercozoa sp. M6MM]
MSLEKLRELRRRAIGVEFSRSEEKQKSAATHDRRTVRVKDFAAAVVTLLLCGTLRLHYALTLLLVLLAAFLLHWHKKRSHQRLQEEVVAQTEALVSDLVLVRKLTARALKELRSFVALSMHRSPSKQLPISRLDARVARESRVAPWLRRSIAVTLLSVASVLNVALPESFRADANSSVMQLADTRNRMFRRVFTCFFASLMTRLELHHNSLREWRLIRNEVVNARVQLSSVVQELRVAIQEAQVCSNLNTPKRPIENSSFSETETNQVLQVENEVRKVLWLYRRHEANLGAVATCLKHNWRRLSRLQTPVEETICTPNNNANRVETVRKTSNSPSLPNHGQFKLPAQHAEVAKLTSPAPEEECSNPTPAPSGTEFVVSEIGSKHEQPLSRPFLSSNASAMQLRSARNLKLDLVSDLRDLLVAQGAWNGTEPVSPATDETTEPVLQLESAAQTAVASDGTFSDQLRATLAARGLDDEEVLDL